jgi:hypothetical protein
LRSLIGDQAQMSLNPTMAATPRDPTPPPSSFEGLRGGQFYLNRLTIIDAFGQTLEVVEAPVAPDQFPRTFDNFVFQPLVADGLTPTRTLRSQEPERFVQLPPRLLQPARLNLDFQLKENGSPIIGWILPNHLDSGIAVYGPDGSALGTLRLGVDAAGVPVATWDAAPHSSWPMLPDPSEDLPDFQNFVATLRSQGAAALREFLKSVDESLWTVDPLGGPTDSFLSILIGRPLAAVSATLSFELLADPLRDVNWPYTFSPPSPLFLGYKFPVRLGDLGYRQDGLIGYFAGRDFTRFNCIHLPQSGPGDPPLSPYLKAIAPDNHVNIGFADRGPGPAANLVLLMDPRAGVHAQCGLLPVKQATLLPAWVDSALNAMVATFRTGPALVSQQPAAPRDNGQAPGGEPATALLLPRFAQLRGDLTWLERNGDGDWSEMALAPIDGSARLAATAPTLREGLLKLSLNK